MTLYHWQTGIIQQDIPSYSSTSNLSYSEGEPVQHGATNTDTMQVCSAVSITGFLNFDMHLVQRYRVFHK
jgi:hypothetical protein